MIDASAVVESLTVGQHGLAADDDWHAPHLLDFEVSSTLRRGAYAGDWAPSFARECLGYFMGLEIERHPARGLLPRMWELRHDISAYDASYVALAEALGVPLVTLDRRLATTARRYCDVIAD